MDLNNKISDISLTFYEKIYELFIHYDLLKVKFYRLVLKYNESIREYLKLYLMTKIIQCNLLIVGDFT